MTLVSVVIPCFRDVDTLPRALDSVLNQTHRTVEIIVVNDCSPDTDRMEQCLKQYPTVRYVKNAANVGLAATRNAGIRQASGEFLAFLDADDEYHPEKISAQLAAMEPGMVVTCGTLLIGPDGSRTVAPEGRRDRHVTLAHEFALRNTLNGAAMLAPKSILIANGCYDASLRSCEDFDLYLRLLQRGVKVRNVGRPLYIYHYNPKGLSKNARNISAWEFEAIMRYATRMGETWKTSFSYAALIAVWSIRHLLRSEVQGSRDLREDALRRLDALKEFPLIAAGLKMIARARVLRLVAVLMQARTAVAQTWSDCLTVGKRAGFGS